MTKDVSSNSIYTGNPVKFVYTFDEYTKKHIDNQENYPIFR